MTDERPQLPLEGLLRRLLGERGWSPEGRSILELALHSGLRTRANWLVPGLAGLLTVAGLFVFRTSRLAQEGFPAVFFRIFLFDFLLFILAWVSGWNMSRRWRDNPELIEELTLTPIRPAHTLLAASGGLLGAWAYVLMLVLVAEVVFFFVGKYMQIPLDGPWGAKDAFGLALDASIITVVSLPGLVALALFHFQSVRLAHAMFSLGALPRVPLGRLALNNLMLIMACVAGLSAIGCMVAGIVWIPLAILGTTLGRVSSMWRGEVAMEVSWLLASIAGYWAVGLMKGSIARSFMVQFGRRWAMFSWWGAAELAHPYPYPPNYEAAATSWSLHQVAEELMQAPDASPAERRRARDAYLRSLAVTAIQRTAPSRAATILPPLSAPPSMTAPLSSGKGLPPPGASHD